MTAAVRHVATALVATTIVAAALHQLVTTTIATATSLVLAARLATTPTSLPRVELDIRPTMFTMRADLLLAAVLPVATTTPTRTDMAVVVVVPMAVGHLARAAGTLLVITPSLTFLLNHTSKYNLHDKPMEFSGYGVEL
ncbi:hypothetical protein LTS18_003017 [Coniosporium uncinatum]|uniref:Uncharacterized protein n=1 Tax=Coniosporium uncinatum TaxID=93489 RepID=A0ACC3D760_9PEZI|nr:hypothetical protein LTS18_003017 [Coniosporium uncinatum]